MVRFMTWQTLRVDKFGAPPQKVIFWLRYPTVYSLSMMAKWKWLSRRKSRKEPVSDRWSHMPIRQLPYQQTAFSGLLPEPGPCFLVSYPIENTEPCTPGYTCCTYQCENVVNETFHFIVLNLNFNLIKVAKDLNSNVESYYSFTRGRFYE